MKPATAWGSLVPADPPWLYHIDVLHEASASAAAPAQHRDNSKGGVVALSWRGMAAAAAAAEGDSNTNMPTRRQKPHLIANLKQR
jgi:hypothetical protein